MIYVPTLNYFRPPLHRGAICQFLFQWIYYCHSSKSTWKKTGKTHLCALLYVDQLTCRTPRVKSPNACLHHTPLLRPNLFRHQEQSNSVPRSLLRGHFPIKDQGSLHSLSLAWHHSSESHVMTGLRIYISDVIVFVNQYSRIQTL